MHIRGAHITHHARLISVHAAAALRPPPPPVLRIPTAAPSRPPSTLARASREPGKAGISPAIHSVRPAARTPFAPLAAVSNRGLFGPALRPPHRPAVLNASARRGRSEPWALARFCLSNTLSPEAARSAKGGATPAPASGIGSPARTPSRTAPCLGRDPVPLLVASRGPRGAPAPPSASTRLPARACVSRDASGGRVT